jgi:imidazole glycerol-phosphate synthase subunit HisF
MLIIPAIDLIKGNCVRLEKGDYSKLTVYSKNPEKVAQKFKKMGVKFLHVIDLEGAKKKELSNISTVSKLANILPIQVGGGIRTEEDIDELFKIGVSKVILGTIAFQNPKLLKNIIKKYGPEKIIVSLDCKKDKIMLKGWLEDSQITLDQGLNDLKKAKLKYLIFTDIEKDGMLKGINIQKIKNVLKYGFKTIIAGGVTSSSDIKQLEKLKAYGCIIGKALYEGKIELSAPNDLAKRIIPCMDIKNNRVVKGTNFVNLKDAGDPVELAKYYSEMGADELVFLDIMATVENRKTLYELVEKIAKNINIPFTVGGGISTISDIRSLLNNGADKISIGSYAVKNPDFVKKAAKKFGSQCIVISIDPKKINNKWKVFIKGGRQNTNIDAIEFAKEMEQLGAGEFLVNSLDRDGMKNGYDIPLLKAITEAVNIPVIASSGAGSKEDFLEVFEETKVDAALAASLFHYQEIKIPELKQYLLKNNITIRI